MTMLTLVRVFCNAGLAMFLFSLKLYFHPAVELLAKEPAGEAIAGLAYLRAYSAGDFLPWHMAGLSWLIAVLALEFMFQMKSISKDAKAGVMAVVFAAFYTLPLHAASGFRLAVGWPFWVPQMLFLTIISMAVYGQFIFPLGPREIGELKVRNTDLTREGLVMAVTGTMQYEHGIAQTATGIAIALGITVGIGALGGFSMIFRNPATLIALTQYYGLPLLWAYVGFITYLMLQMRKSSMLSEYLRQIIRGVDLPFAGTQPDDSAERHDAPPTQPQEEGTVFTGDMTAPVERVMATVPVDDRAQSVGQPNYAPKVSDDQEHVR